MSNRNFAIIMIYSREERERERERDKKKLYQFKKTLSLKKIL